MLYMSDLAIAAVGSNFLRMGAKRPYCLYDTAVVEFILRDNVDVSCSYLRLAYLEFCCRRLTMHYQLNMHVPEPCFDHVNEATFKFAQLNT